MLKKILLAALTTGFMTNLFAEDISGTWQQIDDKSGAAKAVIVISKEANDTYSGKIVKVTPRVGYTPREKCNNCPAPYTNQPILGMTILKGLKHVEGTNTYEKGRIMDPLAGKVYDAKMRLNNTGKRLTLRASVGVSVLGRNQTWIRAD